VDLANGDVAIYALERCGGATRMVRRNMNISLQISTLG
jgi:hypothetical protein